MSFEAIKKVSEQIVNRLPSVRGKGEEATKQALVLPMLDALGFDIWNPSEVCPEYEADFAIKKQGQKEKVDIAISLDNVPRIYFEVKSVDTSLDGHEGQLARYFNATPSVTLGVMTNGIEWRFYTDTGDPNVMDPQPFHTARLDSVDQGLEVMTRFGKSIFSAEAIRDYATELLYTAKMAGFLRAELDLRDRDPSEHFIRWILKSESMYEGVVNGNVVERFRPIVKAAITRVLREVVRRSIAAMDEEAAQPSVPAPAIGTSAASSHPPSPGGDDPVLADSEPVREIVTTEKELATFASAKLIWGKSGLEAQPIYDSVLKKDVPASLSYKDTTGYFGVYITKPAWWVLRAVFTSRTSWIGFNLAESQAVPLIPAGMTRLPPSPFATIRVAVSGPEDLTKLENLALASMRGMMADRNSTKD